MLVRRARKGRKLLARRENLLVPDDRTGFFYFEPWLCHPFNIAFLIQWLRQDMESYPTCAAYTAFTFITNSLSKASFFGIAALSVDRFLAIHLHLRYQGLVTHRRVVAVVVLVWILSVFFGSFQVVGHYRSYLRGFSHQWVNNVWCGLKRAYISGFI